MTRYKPTLEQQFAEQVRSLRARIGTLEQRTNPLGTNSDGSVTVSNLTVVGASGGSLTVNPNPGTLRSPVIQFYGGVPGITATPGGINSNVNGTIPNQFESLFGTGPIGAGDANGSYVFWELNSGGSGTDAAHGELVWLDTNTQAAVAGWDQWGLTLTQPYTGSLASLGATVTGSAIQNDQPPSGGELAKFIHAAGYSGNSNASGEIAFNHGCSFTPQGMLVQANAAGIANNLTIGIETAFTSTTATFSVKFADTNTAYSSRFLTFYALLWG